MSGGTPAGWGRPGYAVALDELAAGVRDTVARAGPAEIFESELRHQARERQDSRKDGHAGTRGR